MTALVTGATGFIGRALVSALNHPRITSRNPNRAEAAFGNEIDRFPWTPTQTPIPAARIAGLDVIYHLAGEPVASGRWSESKKAKIRESRVRGTENLVAGIESLVPGDRPLVLVCGSAVGYYGDRADEPFDESAEPGTGFLPEVCQEWEAAAGRARDLGVRVVNVRTGIVLGAGGGALKKMLLPFKLGLGGRLGPGTQWMPWIHIDDEVGLLVHAARTDSIDGPLNACAPNPARNIEFTKTLGAVLGRPTFMPVPMFGLRLAFGDLADMLIESQQMQPRLALDSGYKFAYPELEPALRAVLNR